MQDQLPPPYSLSLSHTHTHTHTHTLSLSRSYREIFSFTLRTAVLTKFSCRRYFPLILFVQYFIPSSVANDLNPSSPQTQSSTDVQKEVQTTCVDFFWQVRAAGFFEHILNLTFEPWHTNSSLLITSWETHLPL